MTRDRKYEPKSHEDISVPEWAYAAGVMDGEGSITMWQQKRYGQVVLRISIGNSHLQMLEWLRERFGGSIHAKWRYVNLRVYHWQCSARIADAFLRGCLPFLMAKRQEAEVGLRLYSEGVHTKYVPKSEHDRRQSLRHELRQVRLDRRLPRGDKVVTPFGDLALTY